MLGQVLEQHLETRLAKLPTVWKKEHELLCTTRWVTRKELLLMTQQYPLHKSEQSFPFGHFLPENCFTSNKLANPATLTQVLCENLSQVGKTNNDSSVDGSTIIATSGNVSYCAGIIDLVCMGPELLSEKLPVFELEKLSGWQRTRKHKVKKISDTQQHTIPSSELLSQFSNLFNMYLETVFQSAESSSTGCTLCGKDTNLKRSSVSRCRWCDRCNKLEVNMIEAMKYLFLVASLPENLWSELDMKQKATVVVLTATELSRSIETALQCKTVMQPSLAASAQEMSQDW